MTKWALYRLRRRFMSIKKDFWSIARLPNMHSILACKWGALWSAVQIYGDSWKADPRLTALFTPSPAHQQHRNISATNASHGQPPHGLKPAAYQWAQQQAAAHRARTSPSRAHTTSGRDL